MRSPPVRVFVRSMQPGDVDRQRTERFGPPNHTGIIAREGRKSTQGLLHKEANISECTCPGCLTMRSCAGTLVTVFTANTGLTKKESLT